MWVGTRDGGCQDRPSSWMSKRSRFHSTFKNTLLSLSLAPQALLKVASFSKSICPDSRPSPHAPGPLLFMAHLLSIVVPNKNPMFAEDCCFRAPDIIQVGSSLIVAISVQARSRASSRSARIKTQPRSMVFKYSCIQPHSHRLGILTPQLNAAGI